jgi:uncharacterized protein YndB with AHSA1/START domain
MHDSVTIHMKATPQRVWELVSDVTRIGRYSPETFEAEWVDGATGPATGAKFRGHVNRNRRNVMRYWTTCTVRECEPGKVFAFGVGKSDRPLNIWRYDIVEAGDGCDVTESFTLTPTFGLRLYWAVLGWSRGKTNRNGMRATLEKVRDDAEVQPAQA